MTTTTGVIAEDVLDQQATAEDVLHDPATMIMTIMMVEEVANQVGRQQSPCINVHHLRRSRVMSRHTLVITNFAAVATIQLLCAASSAQVLVAEIAKEHQ